MLYGRDYSHVSPCDCGNKRPKNGSGCVVCKEPGCEDCMEGRDGDELICLPCVTDLLEAGADDEPEDEPDCSCEQIDVDLVDARGCEVHGR